MWLLENHWTGKFKEVISYDHRSQIVLLILCCVSIFQLLWHWHEAESLEQWGIFTDGVNKCNNQSIVVRACFFFPSLFSKDSDVSAADTSEILKTLMVWDINQRNSEPKHMFLSVQTLPLCAGLWRAGGWTLPVFKKANKRSWKK